MEDNNERLQAFCSVTFDDAFVVRDLKIIEGTKGSFVAMPSRKLTDRCPQCSCKNHLRARFCNQCGAKLDEDRAIRDGDFEEPAAPVGSETTGNRGGFRTHSPHAPRGTHAPENTVRSNDGDSS